MKKLSLLTLTSVLFLAVLATGCAQAPQAKLDEAQAALAAADEAEADVYVPEQYTAAQDSFAAAQAEIEVQNSRFALTRSYGHAEALLQSAVDVATASTEQVAAKKEEARVEADSLIVQAQAAVAQARALLAKAPRGKDGGVALVSIQEDAGSAESLLNEAVAAQQSGEYAKARDNAKAALDKASGLVAEMNQTTGAARS